MEGRLATPEQLPRTDLARFPPRQLSRIGPYN
jgi:hypothetical protein